MHGGNIRELPNYQGGEFAIEPAQSTTNSKWDMEKTPVIAGGAYGLDIMLMNAKIEFISAVSKTDIIIYDVVEQKETKYSRNGIPNDLINRGDAQISFIKYTPSYPAISYPYVYNGTPAIRFQSILDPEIQATGGQERYNFNGGTNKIPSTFISNADGSLTVKYTNADGTARQYTFK